jgi:hypothetical protein
MTDLHWRTSSFTDNGTCVEVADLPDGDRLIRDTKLGESSPTLRFTSPEWTAFIAGVKAGEFD